jgi:deazaflavin-dependent oxidoreductase (nitroreductase family)
VASYNQALIDQLRASGGEIMAGPMAGRPLLILTTRGARSGADREAVLTFTRDGERYVVAGTAGGSPTVPAWVHNLRAHPEVRVEARGRTFQARATIVDEDTRRRLWAAHVAERPEFAEYPAKARRVIPVITLEPIGD